ncbi:cilia- and flagella-associated protein 161-like [Ptychodera flava]|uniref:cilia- and flagella-associated protein 161-like n=1 Tax=Ptychodera flava TaxID=63121 RepID=UPI003969F64E
MSVRTYNPSVLVGNWSEDICLEEDTLKDFLEKKERGELSIQKASKLSSSILRKTELSITGDGYVHFGDCVMLVNPGAKDETGVEWGQEPRAMSALAVNMDESKMHEAQKFEGPCGVSATRSIQPTARSIFVIMPVDNSPPGAALTYGQHFLICTPPNEGGNLKLHSDIATFTKSSKKTRQQEVTLVDDVSYLTQWKVIAFNPLCRMEMEGLPVPANQKIVLLHCKSHQGLSVVSSASLRTPFGREYEVTAHTNLDSHRAEEDSNHWVFVTGTPSDPSSPEQPLPVGARQ